MKKIDWLSYFYVIAGAACIAVSFNGLLLPNKIASGGVSGISTILSALFHWNPAYIQYSINIPLFILGFFVLGASFGIKTFIGTIALPAFVLLTENIPTFTTNPLLAALYGGVLTGTGLGIVFYGGASTGGTDIIAKIMHKYTRFSLGLCMGIVDGLVVLSAMIVFNIEAGLFALITLYVTSRMIDIIQTGFNRSKTVFIISNETATIQKEIVHVLDKGVTKIKASGGYDDSEKQVLMCVVRELDFFKLKQTVLEIDEHAFVVAMSATEVMGKGFTITRDLL